MSYPSWHPKFRPPASLSLPDNIASRTSNSSDPVQKCISKNNVAGNVRGPDPVRSVPKQQSFHGGDVSEVSRSSGVSYSTSSLYDDYKGVSSKNQYSQIDTDQIVCKNSINQKRDVRPTSNLMPSASIPSSRIFTVRPSKPVPSSWHGTSAVQQVISHAAHNMNNSCRGDDDSLFCKPCNMRFETPETHNVHIKSTFHFQSLERSKTSPENNRKKLETYCDVCCFKFSNKEMYDSHLNGLAHKKKLEIIKESLEQQRVQEENKNKILKKEKDTLDTQSYHNSDNGGPNGTFFCEVCAVSCAGIISYEMHLKGAKHQKNLTGFVGREYSEVPRVKSTLKHEEQRATLAKNKDETLRSQIESCQDALIGLQYIVEFRASGTPADSRHCCSLCMIKLNRNQVVMHLQGISHREKYFKYHDPAKYNYLKDLAQKSLKNLKAKEFACQTELKDGRKNFKIKTVSSLQNINYEKEWEDLPLKRTYEEKDPTEVREPQPVVTKQIEKRSDYVSQLSSQSVAGSLQAKTSSTYYSNKYSNSTSSSTYYGDRSTNASSSFTSSSDVYTHVTSSNYAGDKLVQSSSKYSGDRYTSGEGLSKGPTRFAAPTVTDYGHQLSTKKSSPDRKMIFNYGHSSAYEKDEHLFTRPKIDDSIIKAAIAECDMNSEKDTESALHISNAITQGLLELRLRTMAEAGERDDEMEDQFENLKRQNILLISSSHDLHPLMYNALLEAQKMSKALPFGDEGILQAAVTILDLVNQKLSKVVETASNSGNFEGPVGSNLTDSGNDLKPNITSNSQIGPPSKKFRFGL